MSLYISNPNDSLSISSLHFYAWKNGLKTGMYYLRTKSAAKTIKFTIESGELMNLTSKCNEGVCKMCQS
jgi:ribonucleoside-diphosphate reductase alpha chain